MALDVWNESQRRIDQKKKKAYSTPCLIVAGDYDLFLLHSQREGLERGVLVLEDACVEAVLWGVSVAG